MNTYFMISVAVLAILLYFPASRLVWVFSVRRLEKKKQSAASDQEINFQRKRARVLTIPIVVIFSYLFCVSIGISQ